MKKPRLPADLALDGLSKGKADYRVLYKYQRINERSLDALRNRYLFFSSYHQLNDPFDPFLMLIAGRVGGDLALTTSDLGPKIFCVSEKPLSPLMWAHYADSWAGMCIGYAVFTGNPSLFTPVTYIDEVIGRFNVLEFLFFKSPIWKWEAEWRACIPGHEQKLCDIAHPVSICLGPRCSTGVMRQVQAAMPETVKRFEIMFPRITDNRPALATFDVKAVVDKYGGIPALGDLIREAS